MCRSGFAEREQWRESHRTGGNSFAQSSSPARTAHRRGTRASSQRRGGVCACRTCHIYVESGASSCNEANDDEADMLDTAPALKSTSRLACQCVPDGSAALRVRIPRWNRNAVKEGH